MALSSDEIVKIRKTLEEVWDNDQKYRSLFNAQEFLKKYGMDSKEVKNIIVECDRMDKDNLNLITNIINKYGWLGEDIIGFKANMALFLVIQHAGLDVHMKYLPIVEQAVKDGNLRLKDYAIFKDRVEIEQNKPQIYGSQFFWNDNKGQYEMYPTIDVDSIDERRKIVGLEPIEVELAKYGLNIDDIKQKNVI